MKQRKITRKDIAEHAGVSSSTAGMILSGHGERYHPETRDKVMKAAEELNYSPSLFARSLRSGKSYLVGILASRTNSSIMMDFLRGVMDAVMDSDYSPVVFSHTNPEEERACLAKCLDRRVDGLIVTPSLGSGFETTEAAYQPLIEQGFPLVELFGRNLPGAPSATIDSAAVARVQVKHLVQLGHRHIAMVTHARYRHAADAGGGQHIDAWQRYTSYAEAMEKAGLEPMVVTHPLEQEIMANQEWVQGGVHAFDALVKKQPRPTAVICYSDYEAYGIIRGCRLKGIDIPGELSVIGFADQEVSSVTSPALSTVGVSFSDAGNQTVRMVLDRIDGKPITDTVFPPKLIVRESTAAPRT